MQKKAELEFVWVGSVEGPEKAMIENEGMKYYSVSSGKLRRYFSFDNFF